MEQGGLRLRLADLTEEVLGGLAGRLVRTVGLVLVFAVGTGGVVTALGISATASQQVQDRLTAAALDHVTVRPVDAGGSSRQLSGFTPDAVRRLAGLPSVRLATMTWAVPGSTVQVARVRGVASSPVPGLRVLGGDSATAAVLGGTVVPRSATHLLDQPRTPHVALLGRRAAEALGVTRPGPGARIVVGGVQVEVVGLLTASAAAPGLTDTVVVPLPLARSLSGGSGDPAVTLLTRPGRAYAVSRVVASVINPDRPGAAEVDPVPDLRALKRGVRTDLDTSAGALAVLMLTLASITTANVMTMNVTERRTEIALRRAVGTSRRRIRISFLLEGAVVGAVGGALGAGLGVLAVVGIALYQGWAAVLPLWIAPTGLAAGLVIGTGAAARAAGLAADIQPALAIRRE